MLISELPSTNAVKFGNLYYKPKDFNKTISKTCRMVLLEADNPELPLGRSGSSTLIRYCGKRYVVLTRHQLNIQGGEIPDTQLLDTIRIVSGHENLVSIPLNNCIFETSNSDQEYHDLLFFEVNEQWANQHLDAPYFVPVSSFSKKKESHHGFMDAPSSRK